ncbi:unnamed protein product [Rhizoctonia solani]|uniref:Heme peroxidase n=1 Tax=Rhizoctonia solani TaxID=456999 RepID=A0A8H3E6C4_9AGAM|nr:unnamed protein product [Rhizoctonia solani]
MSSELISSVENDNGIFPLVPPQLPPFLANVFNLKPILSNPSGDEVKLVHEAIRALNNLSQTPELRDKELSVELSQHLFDIQMVCHRQKYPASVLPNEVIYTPPKLPSYIPIDLSPVTGPPSNKEIGSIHAALRISDSFANVPSIFDPELHAELSQHLFDIQLARHVQRSMVKQFKSTPASKTSAPREGPSASDVGHHLRQDESPKSNFSGTTGHDESQHPVIEQPNPPEVATSRQIPGEIGDLSRTNELIVELRETMKNMTRVLIGSQNSLARGFNSSARRTSHSAFAYDLGAHSLINDYGEIPEAYNLPTFNNNGRTVSFPLAELNGESLARYLRFYNIGQEVVEGEEELKIKEAALRHGFLHETAPHLTLTFLEEDDKEMDAKVGPGGTPEQQNVVETRDVHPGVLHDSLYKVDQSHRRKRPRSGEASTAPIARAESSLIRAAEGGPPADDRPHTWEDGSVSPFMSRVFATLAKLSEVPSPPVQATVTRLNNHVIRYLYEAIPHPVETVLGERFRRADGSCNNVHIPSIGQAGTTYARTCQGRYHPTKVPKPEDVFDKLLRASTELRDPHPGGNSAMTFAFASIVTHSLFRTDPRDWNKNLTSSYLDLSPLYGSNQEEQNEMRLKDAGRGRIHPDAFSEGRIVFLPPASAALLVLWNRNHNFIANELLRRNEQGRWRDPPPMATEERLAQDEEIFQTARLINCASFMSVVLNDYVAGFLGIARGGSSWNMEPFNVFRNTNHELVSRGQGNHVSVEFNLLYRWHSVVSSEEEKWTAGILQDLYPNKPPGDLTMADFHDGLRRLRSGDVPPSLQVEHDPRKRNFGGITRGPDGRFKDDDIARILQDATEHPARRYGARGTPEVLRIIEIMSMLQARRWGVCTMNEFRERMGLQRFKEFKDWNSNPEVIAAAKELYGEIDNLELYPGFHAEETMKLGAGSGLCAGYTLTRCILSDAIALVRGDRFFTTDFTPASLTSFGMDDVQRNTENGAFGAYLPHLLTRNLPQNYPANSIYSLFPFFTPETTRDNLKRLAGIDRLRPRGFEYDLNRPPPSGLGTQ